MRWVSCAGNVLERTSCNESFCFGGLLVIECSSVCSKLRARVRVLEGYSLFLNHRCAGVVVVNFHLCSTVCSELMARVRVPKTAESVNVSSCWC